MIDSKNRDSSDFISSNLSQQDIQNIVLFMFNLFAQNIQNQAQVNVDFVSKISFQRKSFRVQNVDFFDSQLDSSYELENVIQIERGVYYKDVYLFIKTIKNAVIMIKSDAIKIDIFSCLKDSTSIW
jgi:ABC-type multidrug transport system permease subunit